MKVRWKKGLDPRWKFVFMWKKGMKSLIGCFNIKNKKRVSSSDFSERNGEKLACPPL